MKFEYNCFTSTDIINAVNEQLKNANSKVKAKRLLKVGGDLGTHCILETNRGAQLLVVLFSFGRLSQFGVRAIHRIIEKRSPYAVLFNGQAVRNLNTLVFNGEDGPMYYADTNKLKAYLQGLFPEKPASFHTERAQLEASNNPIIHKELVSQ